MAFSREFAICLLVFGVVRAHSYNVQQNDGTQCTSLPIPRHDWDRLRKKIDFLATSKENEDRNARDFVDRDSDESLQVYMTRMIAQTQEQMSTIIDLIKDSSGREDSERTGSGSEAGSRIEEESDQKSASISTSRHRFSRNLPTTYGATDKYFRPTDCADHLITGATTSGVYEIYPFRCRCSPPVKVYCDMETSGGGWTVFLSRQPQKNPVNFTRYWDDYKNGFGTPSTEHWLGNEILHILTSSRKYVLRFEAKDITDREVWGEYSNFFVYAEKIHRYKVTLSVYDATSTAYDRLGLINGAKFSSPDQDHDSNAAKNFAKEYQGSWWFKNTHYLHPTGISGLKTTSGMLVDPWSKIDKIKSYATKLQLKIRPLICNEDIDVVEMNTHTCKFPN